jgi:hypothetical protein
MEKTIQGRKRRELMGPHLRPLQLLPHIRRVKGQPFDVDRDVVSIKPKSGGAAQSTAITTIAKRASLRRLTVAA